ncbi:ATP-binding cassette domain-containing protein [Streptomyces sp. NPDC021212]|uniref:ATP-binding cassette domain-containing protein n=1 Tax=Streptomyces sp. NPDC021212 TaxID=3365118 RepID=UPI0037A05218
MRRTRGKEYRRAVPMVFQDPFASLNPAHTVGHRLTRPLPAGGRARRGADAEAKARELLRSVNLTPADDMAHKRPHELSGGQRQRVAIARAPAPGLEVLLADEPVSMLDVSIGWRSWGCWTGSRTSVGSPCCTSRTIWPPPGTSPRR